MCIGAKTAQNIQRCAFTIPQSRNGRLMSISPTQLCRGHVTGWHAMRDGWRLANGRGAADTRGGGRQVDAG